MRYKLDTNYSEEERQLLTALGCEIIAEIQLSDTRFADNETPIRMIKHGSQYIAEITDDETDCRVWAVLSKWKGVWHFESYYDSLEILVNGI